MSVSRSQPLALASSHFHSIFPAIHLPTLTHPSHSSFLTQLDELTKMLPVPGATDLPTTLSTMRQLMDEQEYKYQKSLLETEQNEMIIFDEECNYNQNSTNMTKKATGGCDQQQSSFVEDIWNWRHEKEVECPIDDYYCFID